MSCGHHYHCHVCRSPCAPGSFGGAGGAGVVVAGGIPDNAPEDVGGARGRTQAEGGG